MTVLKDTRRFLSRHSVKNKSLLIAVSGGIDSITLLHALYELRKEFELNLYVAHLDHGLRGESSAKDAEFVRQKATELNLGATVEKRRANQLAEEESLTLEEAARKVRYNFLNEVAREKEAEFVALGHNKNDQAETILMHIIRGAGLRGLGGMQEKSGRYLRPLLRTSREVITSYVEEKGIDYRVDETNRDTSFTRNRVRHELIPKLEEDFNARIIDNLLRLGNIARDAHSFVEARASEALKQIRINENGKGKCFKRDEFLDLHTYLQKAVLRKLLAEVKGDLEDITYFHVEEVLEKLRQEPASTRLDLPGAIFSLDRNRACLGKEFPGEDRPSFNYELTPGRTMEIEEADLKITCDTKPFTDQDDIADFSSDRLIEAVDWRKVERPIVVRNRKEGDRFVPLGMTGNKKLNDFFIDEKIPVRKRDRVPLVCDSKGIIWVVGYRLDDRYRVDKTTDKILIIKARDL